MSVDTEHTNKGRASELIDELKSSAPRDSSSSTSSPAVRSTPLLSVYHSNILSIQKDAGGERANPSDAVRDPSEWTTGADAATQKQKAYIAVLEKRAGEGVHDLGGLSKAEASEKIEDLRDRTGDA